MAAIHLLIPLERVLRFAWNMDRYCAGGGLQEPEPGDVRGVKVQLAHEAISSAMWWAYTVMLDGVSEALLEVAKWAEGCPMPYRAARSSRPNPSLACQSFSPGVQHRWLPDAQYASSGVGAGGRHALAGAPF